MSDVKCFDASTQIPEETPEGCEAVLGYLGLPPHDNPAARHAWTLAEWLRFKHLRQFPAWVAGVGSGDSAAEGRAQGAIAVAATEALGWHHGRLIICDLEAWADPHYWAAWKAKVERQGYRAGWYGSKVNEADYPCDWKWLALYDGVAEIPAGFEAKQYAADVRVPGGVVDLSVVSRQMLEHGGVGPRKG